jgi:Xaa-Pro aminopeptidase
MANVLVFGDTLRSPEMRHEVPLMVPDPFLYAEVAGRRHVVVNSLEHARIAEVDATLVVHSYEEYGVDEIIASGASRFEALLRVLVRACHDLGVGAAAVPAGFPVELADHLRAAGVAVAADRETFNARRRVKSVAELAGIRRAQESAQEGMRAAAALLRAAQAGDGGLVVDGEALTCERVKAAIDGAVSRAGGNLGDGVIVSHGAQTAIGHELGSGQIHAGEPIVIDLWPRDPATTCFADMTRTFVVGEVPDAIRRFHELTREALERSREALRAGADATELFGLACEPYEREGIPTQRTKAPGEMLERGFFHSLGHGVGLEVHEAPVMGRAPDTLVAGDVVTLEPGCYEPGVGGCRLEDLVLVGEDSYETLTEFPYELEP